MVALRPCMRTNIIGHWTTIELLLHGFHLKRFRKTRAPLSLAQEVIKFKKEEI